MSIGAGIFLMMVGAILAFGVRDRGGAVNVNVIGIIVMVAGAAGIWLSYRITAKRQRAVPTQAIDPVAEEQYREVQGNPGDGTDTAPQPVERQVRLEPDASDLPTPIPDRVAPRDQVDQDRR